MTTGRGKAVNAQVLHRRLQAYLASPLVVLKDLILVCLAIPGLVALLKPTIACGQVSTIRKSSHAVGHGPAQAPLGSCNCGASTAEAVAMGCRYDSLAAAWLPGHCRDEQLTAEFDKSGDGPNGAWKYWLDLNHTKEITLDDLRTRGDDKDFRFYSTMDWHIVHCLFYWRKQFRARFNGVTVEPRYDSEEHLNHCGAMFRIKSDLGVVSGVVLESDHL